MNERLVVLSLHMSVILLFGCQAPPDSSSSDDPREAAYQRGLTALDDGDTEQAIIWFDEALAVAPTRATILRAKSQALEAAGHHDESLFVRARAEDIWPAARHVELHPDSAAAWYGLGIMFTGGGNDEPALACFERAVALEPSNADYQFYRAWYGYLTDDLEESLRRFELAIELNPHEPRYHAKMADFLVDAERFEDAIAALDRAQAIDPAWEGSLQRALLFMKLDQYQDAFAILDRAAANEPTSRAFHMERGWCLHKLGRYQEALTSYDRAASFSVYGRPIKPWSFGRSERLWFYRGMTLAALHRYQEAETILRAFVDARPGFPGADDELQRISVLIAQRRP